MKIFVSEKESEQNNSKRVQNLSSRGFNASWDWKCSSRSRSSGPSCSRGEIKARKCALETVGVCGTSNTSIIVIVLSCLTDCNQFPQDFFANGHSKTGTSRAIKSTASPTRVSHIDIPRGLILDHPQVRNCKITTRRANIPIWFRGDSRTVTLRLNCVLFTGSTSNQELKATIIFDSPIEQNIARSKLEVIQRKCWGDLPPG